MNRKKIFLCLVLVVALAHKLYSQTNGNELKRINLKQYDIFTQKMDIIPGMWRPMFESEQVAWISPPWESQEYIWFDFPEAIWADGSLLYLGHIDKRFPTLFPTEKSAAWIKSENGISYRQVLPNGVSFGGDITKKEENIASLELWIKNGSEKELRNVKMLTCVYLGGIKEFNEKTNNNKYVHIPGKGWLAFPEAENLGPVANGFRVGWLDGTEVSDLPVIVTKSKTEGHLIAFTWFNDTYSFIGNENHPCVHADPIFKNLKPIL